MLASALNFAIGFFGYPYDGMYEQSITIEADGVNIFGLTICVILNITSSPV
jgi:hypothetical protein